MDLLKDPSKELSEELSDEFSDELCGEPCGVLSAPDTNYGPAAKQAD